MPKLILTDIGEFEVPASKRLVNALEDDCHIDQLHNCGGNGKCTACRVQFVSGEPTQLTQTEKDRLTAKGITDPGVRLSCQMLADRDMTLTILSRLRDAPQRKDAGARCADVIEPEPVWVSKER